MSRDDQFAPSATPAAAAEPRADALNRIYSLLRFGLATAALALSVWLLSDVLVVVFASALLAVILHGSADLLRRVVSLPHWAALAVVALLIVAALAALAVLAGPGLAEQADALRKSLDEQGQALQAQLHQSQWGRLMLRQVPAFLGGEKQGEAPSVPSGFAGSMFGILSSVFGVFGTVAVVAIAALYLAASPGTYVDGALRLVPVMHRGKAKRLTEVAGQALWSWSAGQALDMVVVGLLSGLGLWALGVPLALVLGALAGLTNFVPYIGAIVGAVPAVIIAFSVSRATGVETVVLYLAIQGFEGNVMAPLIQKRAVDLPPGLTVLSQTAFGAILGIPGLVFATPLTAALLAVLDVATPPLSQADRADVSGPAP